MSTHLGPEECQKNAKTCLAYAAKDLADGNSNLASNSLLAALDWASLHYLMKVRGLKPSYELRSSISDFHFWAVVRRKIEKPKQLFRLELEH